MGMTRQSVVACPFFGTSSTKALVKSNVDKHAASNVHRMLASNWIAGSIADGNDVMAPIAAGAHSTVVVKNVMDMVRSKPHDRTGLGASKKRRRLIWCLAEAYRAILRNFLRKPHFSTILQDSTSEKLLMRIKACSQDIQLF